MSRSIQKFVGVLLTVIISALSIPSQAALQDEIQVYDDEINAKGEYSLELHVNSTPSGVTSPAYPGAVINQGNTRITPEFAYGLGNGLELGAYLNTVIVDGNLNYAGFKGRLKWLPILEKDGYDFFAGVNFEVSNTLYQYEQSRYSAEARFILGKHIDKWLVVVNPIFNASLSQPYTNQNPGFNLAARVSREVTEELALGVEYYSNVGSLNQPVYYQQTGQAAFLMMYWEGAPIPFQFGVGKGFTQNTDAWTIKGIFSIPIN